MVNLDGVKKIIGSGWNALRKAECTWLAEQATTRKCIVEIGTFYGTSAVVLAENTSGEVYCVDDWTGGTDYTAISLMAANNDTWENTYDQCIKNTANLRNVHIIRKSSLDAANLFSGIKQFDMVFIDASHDYESVKKDIEAWRPLLSAGGLLCGHDFNEALPGVEQAVKECLGPSGYRRAAGYIWVAE